MNLRPLARTSAPVVAAASLTLLLAACGGSSAKSTSSGCSLNSPTAMTKAVTVTGAFNTTPAVKLNCAIKASGTQKSVLIPGKGAVPGSSDTVELYLSVFDSAGKKLTSQDSPIPLSSLSKVLIADHYGTRTLIAAPASSVFGPNSLPSGVKANDAVIIVSDMVGKIAPVSWTTQAPTVTFDAKGKPTVKLHGKPMAAWAIKVLRQGTGAVVKSGDNVTVKYQGTSWDTGKIFDQSYGKKPDTATFNTTQVVTGFGGALVGQKVGTRLIVTMPPKYGYGTAPGGQGGLGGQTLVFVIEIEKAASAG